MGPLGKMPVNRVFFYITFRVSSKGATPPGSLHRATMERDSSPLAPFNDLSEFSVNGPLPKVACSVPM
jgi:hypothetical protein